MHGAALAWALAASLVSPSGQQPVAAPPAAFGTTDAEQEAFLAEAKVVKTRAAGGGGITGALRVTLRLGELQHDALVQSIDEEKPFMDLARGRELEFRDSYKGNVAAYRLDRLLGLGMVPVSVVRVHDGKRCGFTWWVDDVQLDERTRLAKKLAVPDTLAWNRQMWVVRLFDQLIFNTDRNLGNLLIDKDWRLWMIDHTRAFKTFTEPKSPKNLSTQCARGLLEALRHLDQPTLAAATKDLLIGGPGQGPAGPPRLHREVLRRADPGGRGGRHSLRPPQPGPCDADGGQRLARAMLAAPPTPRAGTPRARCARRGGPGPTPRERDRQQQRGDQRRRSAGRAGSCRRAGTRGSA